MPNQLLPPPELAAQAASGSTPAHHIAMWLDWMRTCDKFLMAGLRINIGPHGDIRAAYRKWYEQQCDKHERVVRHMLSELERREKRA